MRNPLDHYDSPGWFVTHLPNYITLDGVVGEPCSGAGNLSSILPHFKNVQSVWTNDINRNLKADSHFDATNPRSWLEFPETDWVVTNPPFNQAFQILLNAFFFAKKGVVFFVRHSFTEPTEERGEWLSNHPCWANLVYPRFKFVQNNRGTWQTDSAPIDAVIWLRHPPAKLGLLTIPSSKIVGFYNDPSKEPTTEQHLINLQIEEGKAEYAVQQVEARKSCSSP
jgi:hypothetical protein